MKPAFALIFGLAACLAGCQTAPRDIRPDSPADAGQAFFTAYRSYEEITGFITRLALEAPDLVRLREIGRSSQNRTIYAAEISSGRSSDRPALYMDAAHHGNEIITPPVALYFLEYLVTHRQNPEIKQLLSESKLYLIPCVNPDGYEARQRVNANGIDLNRNYSEAWNRPEPNGNPDQNGGKEPFSEPESRAVRDFITRYNDSIRIALTLHSGIDRIHYSRNTAERPTRHDYLLYASLSEAGQKLTNQPGYGPAGVSPLTVSPDGGGRGTTLSWLHAQGIYGFTMECYGDGLYPWPIIEKYYPPEEHILELCKRWLSFNLFMLKSAGQIPAGRKKEKELIVE